MVLSLLANGRKRRRSLTENSCADRRDETLRSDKLSGSEGCDGQSFSVAYMHQPSVQLCAKQRNQYGGVDSVRSEANLAVSSPRCLANPANSEDSFTGSSCCSSLPGYESSHTQKQMLMDSIRGSEAESESWSCCGSNGGEVDIAAFLCEAAVCDDASSEGLSFNPETVFVNDGGFADCNVVEEGPFIGYSAENGSWFLNELDSEGQDCLNEVLDQEWMAMAVANLEKLNDTLTSDSCVLHLLESGNADNVFQLPFP